MSERTPVDFWFDPWCPWAWMTSRWLLQVEKVRPVAPRWHVMSLVVLNEDKDVSDDYRAGLNGSLETLRVLQAVAQKYGGAALGELYTQIGTRIHDQGRREPAPGSDVDPGTLLRDLIAEALEAAGLDRALLAAFDSAEYDEEIRRSHAAAIDLVGHDVGTPVIAVDGVAFFGPVVSPAPKGEDAGKLWDGVLLVAQTDGFFELKRSRTREPVFD
ncbi:disulfide bond formation protein DsbA [Sphaerisporangium sp. TRM90804]|uniref:mycothiol-dependent nitroreductase Rv2466c family protein n=1 Tax=Sphaerisporangium sp. TRM90804 TaxID=3031113 RepID=UPI0024468536|nr:disulfide bond formation protein DsbA [Sphaerisporangium sp. TRM90804]MDH2429754.1 disulfide bond formation protein DsbA [Sphaerisporangium sp. TRM90804]